VIDLSGKVFGHWTVETFSHVSNKSRRWICVCSCGKMKFVIESNLVLGRTKSCGCFRDKASSIRNRRHGDSCGGKVTPEYQTWQHMLTRCRRKTSPDYKNYGGRGITVCDRWMSFENFLSDMGRRPPGKTLERQNNELGYGPDNCVWATRAEQSRNKRSSRILEFRGDRKTITEWSRTLGVHQGTLSARLNRYGWSVERALSEPINGTSKPSLAQ